MIWSLTYRDVKLTRSWLSCAFKTWRCIIISDQLYDIDHFFLFKLYFIFQTIAFCLSLQTLYNQWICLLCFCAILPEGPLRPAADCCPPVETLSSIWAMPAASLPCHRAKAGVVWRWFEPVVQPQLQLSGAWLDSKVACRHHGPPCCVKSQTLKPVRFWTGASSSGFQVSRLQRIYSTYMCFLNHLDSSSLNCSFDVQSFLLKCQVFCFSWL